YYFFLFFFFFQAEDGIRDRNVTGVQTCALPICARKAKTDARGKYCSGLANRTWSPNFSLKISKNAGASAPINVNGHGHSFWANISAHCSAATCTSSMTSRISPSFFLVYKPVYIF